VQEHDAVAVLGRVEVHVAQPGISAASAVSSK
jgi:hypothetical protein